MRYRLYKKKKSNTHFFQILDAKGRIVLQSQPYYHAADRNNGLNAVIRNSGTRERYTAKELDDGSFVFKLFATNGEEIARSPVISAQDAGSFVSDCMRHVPNLKIKDDHQEESPNMPVSIKEEYASDGISDDYKRLAFYEENVDLSNDGYQSFEAGAEHYFALINKGRIILISEGYSSREEADQGIIAVNDNRTDASRYQRRQNELGKHYFNLLARNNIEIGTSAWFDSKEELEEVIQGFMLPKESSNYPESKPKETSREKHETNPLLIDDEMRLEDLVESVDNEKELPDTNIHELIAVTQREISFTKDYLSPTSGETLSNKETTTKNAEEQAYSAANEILASEKKDSFARKPDPVSKIASSEIQTKENPKKSVKTKKEGSIDKKDVKPLSITSSSKQKEGRNGSLRWCWLLLLLPLLFVLFKTCGKENPGEADNQKVGITETEEPTQNKNVVEQQTKTEVANERGRKEPLSTPVVEEEPLTVTKTSSESPKQVAMNEKDLAEVKAQSEITGDQFIGNLEACLSSASCDKPVGVQWTGTNYGYNDSEISTSARETLVQLVNLLKKYPKVKTSIQGHVAQNEDDSYFDKNEISKGTSSLSELRARNVYRFLVEKGISGNRLSYEGKGWSDPISTDNIAPGHRLNKRVEFHFSE